MQWQVEFYKTFEPEFDALAVDVQNELLAKVILLERFGPSLGRPSVDTLNGSRYSNMKELRFSAGDGVWRIAFAFDIERKAILLVAGDKSGGSQKRFYKQLIEQADQRFEQHLNELRERDEHDNDTQGKAGKSSSRPPRKN